MHAPRPLASPQRLPRSALPIARVFAVALVVVLVSCAGCAPFGALLPPGAAGGTFLDEPDAVVHFGPEAKEHRRAIDAAVRELVDANIGVLISLREASLRFRLDLRREEARIIARVGETETVNSSDLARVRNLARRYLELDALLYSLWMSYRTFLPYGSEPDPYAPLRAASLLSSSTRERGGLLSLVAEVTRMENAAVVVSLLEEHHAVTRLLNRGDEHLGVPAESYDRCVGALYDPDHRALLERQLRAFLGERNRLQEKQDPHVSYLVGLLADSALARALVEETDGQRRLRFLWQIASRSALDMAGPVLDAYIAAAYVEGVDP